MLLITQSSIFSINHEWIRSIGQTLTNESHNSRAINLHQLQKYTQSNVSEHGGQGIWCYKATTTSGIYTRHICNSSLSRTVIRKDVIAIGCALTTRDMKLGELATITRSMPFFHTLLPSVCRTISTNYKYKFYLAHDPKDGLFGLKVGMKLFQETYNEIVGKLCPKGGDVDLKLIRCHHTGNPAWAQNDGMMEAYLDNATYFFRVNDDSKIITPGWTEKYIQLLQSYNPPNIGVVGPAHTGGNTRILTHDFVHRTHIEIFGFYYPRIYKNWYADAWITDVYKPLRSTKVSEMKVVHTLERGQRYRQDFVKRDFLHKRIAADNITLNR